MEPEEPLHLKKHARRGHCPLRKKEPWKNFCKLCDTQKLQESVRN